VKSPVSIFRGLALASLSVVSLFFACKLVKDHNKMATLRKRMQLKEINFALKEDQTIIGVVDRACRGMVVTPA